MNFESALRLARTIMMETGCAPDEAAGNPAIPEEHKDAIKMKLMAEEIFELSPPTVLSEEQEAGKWLNEEDRDKWYYWPRLRSYLTAKKGWTQDMMGSLDDSSDKVLRHLSAPSTEAFQKFGLVLGYVQSGKTANYTALIAKAADVGYRLFIVLAGMDKGLRRQTQIRLERELVGYAGPSSNAVELPPPGKQWHTFTNTEMNGDFNAGHIKASVLQPDQPPILMVIKKNSAVLRRVLQWLEGTDQQIIQRLPVLIVDDEADQASIDTRGSRQTENDDWSLDDEEPSRINGLIRELLNQFSRRAYVAYTATPFANILIPANQSHPKAGNDLYPQDFIIALPKPNNYFGAEELFGKSAFTGEEADDGMDVIRTIPEEDAQYLQDKLGTHESDAPNSLRKAILDFALAGATRNIRGDSEKPAAMLVHISPLTATQEMVREIVDSEFSFIRNQWRYSRLGGILEELQNRWTESFQRTTSEVAPSCSIQFNELEDAIGSFLEAVNIVVLNSTTVDALDYEEDPALKAIVIGGNKLSRGLTIEGLLVSYFTREAKQPMYDTVMQMGRWFGYRAGYEDLTRIYTTDSLSDIFSHLAIVEYQLREDLKLYESRRITPKTVGVGILTHPSLLVTSRVKSRFARFKRISYSEKLFQTFRLPLDDRKELALSSDNNLKIVKEFLSELGSPAKAGSHPLWNNIEPDKIMDFLDGFQNSKHKEDITEIQRYITTKNANGELIRWTVAVRQLNKEKQELGTVDWNIGIPINQMSRTRLKGSNSLGVITNPGDEGLGLSPKQVDKAKGILEKGTIKDKNIAYRSVRPAEEGLLLLYPISKYSTPSRNKQGSREKIFESPDSPDAENLIGIAISFPKSKSDNSDGFIYGSTGQPNNDE